MELYNADCLEGMKRIPSGSVDFILADLPYAVTDCAFDKRIPFESMWEQFKRVTKENAAIALFAQGKFQIELAYSNLKMYRYKWVWHKNIGVNFLNAHKMPMREHEDILIFYRCLPTYNPQWTYGKPYVKEGFHGSENYKMFDGKKGWKFYHKESSDGRRYPRDVLEFKLPFSGGKGDKSHPTQKPVDLLEYLIRTYTNEGELVLDATMGSGSTGVACVNTGRDFIGFETEKKFYDVACERIAKAQTEREQNLFKGVAV